MFWFLRKFKKVIYTVIIFRLESTIDGEIWHLKSSHTEFISLNRTFGCENVFFGSKIITLDR
jgi:hypothetical protein